MNMKLSSAAIAAATVLFAVTAMGDVTLTKGTAKSRGTYPRGLSGLTYLGGNQYYAVCDNGNEIGLYPCTIALGSDGLSVSSFSTVATNQAVRLPSTSDLEACAYDPASGNIWVADEAGATIKEYTTNGVVVQTLSYPAILKSKRHDSNRGFESLTISGDGLTMWTCTEEGLTIDSDISAQGSGTLIRLVKFTRATVNDTFTLAAMYPYLTDGWHNPYGLEADGAAHGSGSGRRGVAALTALPDGSLLVLERECSSDTAGNGFWAKLGAEFYYSVYRVSDFASATDVKGSEYDVGLASVPAVKVLKTRVISDFIEGLANYEGMCLGPRLSNGKATILMVTDSGDGNTNSSVLPFTLDGLDIRTVNFAAPSAGESSIVGSNYRFLNGTAIDVNLTGVEYGSVYTNNNAVCSNVQWTATGATPASGTGANASFSVGASDVNFSWTVTDMGHVSTTIDSADSFEEYSVDTLTEGNAIPGWSGDGCVIATNYTFQFPGYPLKDDPHTKVLEVDGEVMRVFDNTTNSNDKLDMMVSISPMGADAPMPDDVSDSQLALVCDSNGKLQLFCKPYDAASADWVSICPNRTFARGDWIRLEISMDYTTNPDPRNAYAYIRINGEYCPTDSGVRSPSDPVQNGPWYRLANVPNVKRINSLTVTNSGYVDDVLKTTSEFVTERDTMLAESADAIDDVPVSFLQNYGDAALLDPNAPVDGAQYPNLAAAGYSVGDMYTAGIDPDDDEPLKVTDFSLDGGNVEVVLNGTRPDTTGKYVVLRSTELNGETTELPGSYSVRNVNGTNVTVWTSTYEIGDDPKAFYRVKAVR